MEDYLKQPWPGCDVKSNIKKWLNTCIKFMFLHGMKCHKQGKETNGKLGKNCNSYPERQLLKAHTNQLRKRPTNHRTTIGQRI